MESSTRPALELTQEDVLRRARRMAETGNFYGISNIHETLRSQGFGGGGIPAREDPARPVTPEEAAVEAICVGFRSRFLLREIADRLEDLRPPDRYALDASGAASVDVFDEVEVVAGTEWPEQWNLLADPEWRSQLAATAAAWGCDLAFPSKNECVIRRLDLPTARAAETDPRIKASVEEMEGVRGLALTGDYASHRDLWSALLTLQGFPDRWIAKVFASRGWVLAEEEKAELRALCDHAPALKQSPAQSLRIITSSLGDGLAPPFGARVPPPASAGPSAVAAAVWVAPRVWFSVSDPSLVPVEFDAADWPVTTRMEPMLTRRGPSAFTLEEALPSEPWERPAP